MIRTENSWLSLYQERGALWLHNGNPNRPHVLLTSGKHSSGFFNSESVMEDPLLLDEAARDLVQLVGERGTGIGTIDRVVGPAMGAITLANDLARHISMARRGHGVPRTVCLRAYAEKDEGEGTDAKTMVLKRTTVKPREKILLCEDVLTTGGSVDLTASAVEAAGGTVLPFVAILVNRSGLKEVNGRKIIALIDRPMPMWSAEECPLCRQGSEAIRRPKGAESWSRLNVVH
jgi:orotate phosphoribosyltransferase